MESASLAWVLVSAALVLFMTPGLAFFYGGMDRSRNVLNMLMMNFYCLLIVPIAVGGRRLLAGPGRQRRLHRQLRLRSFLDGHRRSPRTAAAHARDRSPSSGCSPSITPALISGAVADRMKFSAWAVFVPVWLLLVYVPDLQVGLRRLARRARLARLRRRHRDPRQRRHRRARRGAGARQAQGLAARGPPAALDAAGDARHRHPVVRLVRLQRRLGARRQRPGRAGVHEHVPRRRRRRARLGGRRVDPRRPPDQPRRGVGHRRRAGGHHARPPASCRAWRRSSSARIAGVVVLLRREAEVQGRLRRRPRRRRRALRRRARRLAADRLLRRPRRSSGCDVHGGPVLRRRAAAARRAGCSPTASAIVWSFAVTYLIMLALKKTIGVRVSTTRPRSPASTSPSTPRPRTTDRTGLTDGRTNGATT